jgi:transcriptional regulator with XRE-family HTH domain
MNNKNHNKAFGKVLRQLRKQRGLSQETLAFEASLDRTYVSLLELGTSSPTLDTIVDLSRALHVSFVEIIALTESELNKP